MTAPYMHNGMFKTLKEVIDYYNEPDKFINNSVNRDTSLAKPLGLTEQEKKDLENKFVIIAMMLEYFIVHPLGFYIYWSTLNFKNDGQIIFGAIENFPISSFSFVIIGVIMDLVKQKRRT